MADTIQEPRATTQDVRALRRSPAEGLAEEMTRASTAQVSLREIAYAVMTAVRVEPGSAAARRVEVELGCPLPAGVGQVGGADGRSVLWLGPDEFLTWSPEGSLDPAAAAADLAAGIGSDRGQAVDVSSNRTTLELSGPRAASVLAKSVAMDLHDSAWPEGRAHATLVAGIPALVWRVEGSTYRVLPRSSFAEHLGRWLLDGMSEFADPAGEALWR
ncbi:sarcosine oxidase subunit gamma [Ornithinimicrobium flavum]|uniref:sarcosine oxidase subunit gamma n=1 Tax=Ornithinimicrobium flavum TaxID=1288636 RepID=UPI00106F2BDA|nr:sarcosine oxidase subunit gamma family protein [Ornithinimicrobium flavum]